MNMSCRSNRWHVCPLSLRVLHHDAPNSRRPNGQRRTGLTGGILAIFKVEFMNICFLAGYRREWLFQTAVLDDVRSAARSELELSVRDVVDRCRHSKPIALAGPMHLLWRQE
jgi:hypothetical protein